MDLGILSLLPWALQGPFPWGYSTWHGTDSDSEEEEDWEEDGDEEYEDDDDDYDEDY